MWRTNFPNLSEKYINLVLSFPNLVLKACTILCYILISFTATSSGLPLIKQTCSSCDSTKVRDQKYNKSAFDASLDPIYKEHRMLKLLDIRLLELGKFMYSYKHSLLPIRFRNTFPLNNQTHNYNYARNAVAFKLPFCRTNTRQFSASYQERVLNTLSP